MFAFLGIHQWGLERQRLARQRAYDEGYGYAMTRHFRYGENVRVVIRQAAELSEPYTAGMLDAWHKIEELKHRKA